MQELLENQYLLNLMSAPVLTTIVAEIKKKAKWARYAGYAIVLPILRAVQPEASNYGEVNPHYLQCIRDILFARHPVSNPAMEEVVWNIALSKIHHSYRGGKKSHTKT